VIWKFLVGFIETSSTQILEKFPVIRKGNIGLAADTWIRKIKIKYHNENFIWTT
jgi:hypothetical protein